MIFISFILSFFHYFILFYIFSLEFVALARSLFTSFISFYIFLHLYLLYYVCIRSFTLLTSFISFNIFLHLFTSNAPVHSLHCIRSFTLFTSNTCVHSLHCIRSFTLSLYLYIFILYIYGIEC